mmetsp:Transcript_63547/g.113073  ORF Transcript_63547/g.113073 Transcript_63547/m.113073 type:complete len:176 (-) Transcript_63547:360-887(-)|eukprot:CAMPEP_0197642738 /NCGR_PEP_ID=MMETSP1338-20131121/16313_1 /TAXON_ID=43686 ORGANISM="Pelagodinium beii, Strain RCC1491" /NCGR_SAMPLE_ID=MMETSP1338 /ASSEMBLY_ACC=CAM_ASM_000754 /LENGTH=175 /DNA_ID=CAMNT_0043215907 /DNA_START=94 /DNA_END=621 /DNA_ORIENTATION=+
MEIIDPDGHETAEETSSKSLAETLKRSPSQASTHVSSEGSESSEVADKLETATVGAFDQGSGDFIDNEITQCAATQCDCKNCQSMVSFCLKAQRVKFGTVEVQEKAEAVSKAIRLLKLASAPRGSPPVPPSSSPEIVEVQEKVKDPSKANRMLPPAPTGPAPVPSSSPKFLAGSR